jgi:hypothetical protein
MKRCRVVFIVPVVLLVVGFGIGVGTYFAVTSTQRDNAEQEFRIKFTPVPSFTEFLRARLLGLFAVAEALSAAPTVLTNGTGPSSIFERVSPNLAGACVRSPRVPFRPPAPSTVLAFPLLPWRGAGVALAP